MDQRYQLNKLLFVRSLSARYFQYKDTHRYEPREKKPYCRFIYILRGNALFFAMDQTILAKEGDLVFIPKDLLYVSQWTGDPEIAFYDVNFLMSQQPNSFWKGMNLQLITGDQNEKIFALAKEICACDPDEDEGTLRAFALFYQMLALVLPHLLTPSPQTQLPRALQTAIAYIESNYTAVSSVREIAEVSFVSESRLYHLFGEYLGLSPGFYLNNLRVRAAIELLSTSDLSIQQIAEKLNFNSYAAFRRIFKRLTGKSPSRFRKRQ